MKTVPKKLLSILLALIMVFGCLSASFVSAQAYVQPNNPSQAVIDALAALDLAFTDSGLSNTNADLTGLATFGGTFYDQNVGSSSNQGNPSAGYHTSLVDLTDGGKIIKIAEKFNDLLRTDIIVMAVNTNANYVGNREGYPYTWWSTLYEGMRLRAPFNSYGGAKLHVLAALCSMKANNSISALTLKNQGYSFRRDSDSDRGRTNRAANVSFTVTASEINALKSVTSYSALQALSPKGVPTSISYAINGNYNGSGNNRYNSFTTGATLPAEATYSNTEVNKIIAFNDYFASVLSIDPYGLNITEINDRVTANNTAYASVAEATLVRIFGQAKVDEIKAFMAECVGAQSLINAQPDVAYFMDVPGGFNDRISRDVHLIMKPYDLQVLNAEQQDHYNRIAALPDAAKALAAIEYGLDFVAIDAARAEFKRHIDNLALLAMKEKVDKLVNGYPAYKDAYMGPMPTSPTDQPAYTDYLNYLETYFFAYTDDEIAAMNFELSSFFAGLSSYTTDMIDEVFPLPESYAYVVDFQSALSHEILRRGVGVGMSAVHSYFNKVLRDDLTKLSDTELMALYTEAAGKEVDFFNSMNTARAQIGGDITQQGFDQMYTSFVPTIDQAIDKIGATIYGRVNAQIGLVLDLYDGSIAEVTYENVAHLRSILSTSSDAPGATKTVKELYEFLATTPYITPELIAAYGTLDNAILDKYLKFIENYAVDKHEKLAQEYPTRYPYDTDVARAGDPEKYEVTNELMNATVAKLDGLLTSPGFVDLTGLNIGETVGGLFDGLWSDSIINTLVEALYPAVLDGLEEQFMLVPKNPSSIPQCAHDCLKECLPVDYEIQKLNTKSLHAVLADEAYTFSKLRVYPDLLAKNLGAEYQGTKDLLLQAKAQTVPGDWYGYTTNTWGDPILFNGGSGINLDWGVDKEPEPTLPGGAANPLYGLDKEERFRRGLSTALSGLWEMIAALLCGQALSVYHDAVVTDIEICVAGTADVTAPKINVTLLVPVGTDGYAAVLTPFFEGVFGLDIDDIPTMAQLKDFTNPRQLVDALLDPILYYVREVLGPSPLTAVTELLPNLMYAVILDRIVAALSNLVVDLKINPDGGVNIPSTLRSIISAVCPGMIPAGNTIGEIAGGAVYIDAPLDILDMVSSDSCDFGCTGYPDRLYGCLSDPEGCLGGCLGCLGGEDCESLPVLPCLSFGKMVQYGEMTSTASKRPPSEWVNYVPDGTSIVSKPYQVEALVEELVLDSNGKPIPMMGADGKPIYKLDGGGNKIPVAPGDVLLLDENGDPIQAKYPNGELLWRDTAVALMDDDGITQLTRQKLDSNGDPIPVLDGDGNPTLDGDGNVVYEMEPAFVQEPVYEIQYEVLYQTQMVPGFVTEFRDETIQLYRRETTTKTNNNNHIDADEGDVLLYLIRYLLTAVSGDALSGLLGGLLGDMGDLGDIFGNLGANSEDTIAAVVELFNPKPSGFYAMDSIAWAYADGSNHKVQYTDIWTKEEAQFVADNFKPYLDDVIRLLGVYDDNGNLYSIDSLLDELIGGLDKDIYSSSLLNSLGGTLKDALSGLDLGDEINSLLEDQLGISLTSWDFITEDYFQFEDGDRDAFVANLLKLLRPAYPLLGFLLNSEDIALFGTPVPKLNRAGEKIPVLDGSGTPILDDKGQQIYEMTVEGGVVGASGYEGYAYGVIPILEAFGAKDILTAEQYKAAIAANPDAILTAILNPVLDVLDEILDDPINGILEKLPNILYFLESGGLEVSVNNVLHAAFVLIDTLRPVYPLDLDLFALLGGLVGDLVGVDNMVLDLSVEGITNLVMTFLNGSLETNFVLPGGLDFLMTGTLTPYTSKNLLPAYRMDGSTNSADMITELLRFVVNFLFEQDNRNEVVNLLGGLVGFDLDFLSQIDAIFKSLRDLHKQTFGADLVLDTLLNIFYTVGSFTGGQLNLLDAINKNWVAILAAMESSDVGFLSGFATGLRNFLNLNFKDIQDGGGTAVRGVIPFFSAIWAWIQKIFGWIIWPFQQLIGLFS